VREPGALDAGAHLGRKVEAVEAATRMGGNPGRRHVATHVPP